MKIAVVDTMVPFERGDTHELATRLSQELRQRGHLVDDIRLPFFTEPIDRLPGQMAAAEQTRLDAADKVIALQFPAYLVPHADKTVWLFHQFGQAYDLSDAGIAPFGPGDDVTLRAAVRQADATAFAGARQVFTIATDVSDRLRRFTGIDSEMLLPPLLDGELFTGGDAEPYIFAGGRVTSLGRQHLLVRALAHTPESVRLVIAGPADDAEAAAAIVKLADDLGVSHRLRLNLDFVPRQKIADLVNRATACASVPFDGDSIDYATLEAAEAGKPVITTTDSGGVRGLVADGNTGWVVEPQEDAVAAALTAAIAQPAEAAHRGAELRSAWRALDATWPTTIDRLLA